MEGIDILVGADGINYNALVNVLGQRKLHQNAVNALVGVERIYKLQKILLRCLLGQVAAHAVDAALNAVTLLVAHIYLRGGVCAHQHGGKLRPSRKLGSLGRHLGAYFSGKRLAVNYYCHIDHLYTLFDCIKLPSVSQQAVLYYRAKLLPFFMRVW